MLHEKAHRMVRTLTGMIKSCEAECLQGFLGVFFEIFYKSSAIPLHNDAGKATDGNTVVTE